MEGPTTHTFDATGAKIRVDQTIHPAQLSPETKKQR